MLNVLASEIGLEIKGIQFGKIEVKPRLYTGNIISFYKIWRVLEINYEFSKFAGYQVNIEKSIVFLYNSNGQLEIKTKKQYTLVTKYTKYLKV